MTEKELKIVKWIGMIGGTRNFISITILLLVRVVVVDTRDKKEMYKVTNEDARKMQVIEERKEGAEAYGSTIVNYNDRVCRYSDDCDWMIMLLHDNNQMGSYWELHWEICPKCGKIWMMKKIE